MQAPKKIVKTAKDLSPASAMDKIKAFVSPGSTAGLLRDRPQALADKIKKAGG